MRSSAALVLLGFSVACENTKTESGPKIELPPEAEVKTATRATPAQTATSTTPRAIYRSHFTMGSQVTLTAYTSDEPKAVLAFGEAFREFDRLDRLLSVWKEDSEIVRLNNAAGEAPVALSAETIDLLARAKHGSVETRGKFDVTFGALSGLWKFDHDQDNKIPPAAEVKKRIALIDHTKLILDREKQTAFLEKKGMRVHLGGIGKGYAVDRTIAILKAWGLADFMVQAGGDLYVAGRRGERPWRVGIRDPRGPPDKYFAAAEVTDATFSTSGDYERFFFEKGKRYHHIIDPDTGQPATKSRSVTISALDATTAEWLSKGVFILGAKEGLALVEKIEGAGAVIVDPENKLHISSRLKDKITVLSPPTNAP